MFDFQHTIIYSLHINVVFILCSQLSFLNAQKEIRNIALVKLRACCNEEYCFILFFRNTIW